MPISQFPDETQGGPQTARYTVEEYDYPVDVGTPYKDGGTDYHLKADTKTILFHRDYKTDGFVTELEAKILDDHYDEAKNKAFGFDYYDKDSGIVYENVHYESYERGHGKRKTIQFRMITLKWTG